MPASKSSKKKSTAAKSRAPGKTPASKKSSARKPAAANSKPAAKKTSAKKSAVKKAPAKKTTVKKTAAKKTPARKAAAKSAAPKTVAKKTAKKPAAKKVAAKSTASKSAAKSATRQPATKKAAPAKKAAAKKPAVNKAAATKPAAKKVSASKAPAGKARGAAVKKPLALNPDQVEPSFGFSGPLKGFKPYQPIPGEEYMSEAMRGHFRHVLLAWKQELMEEVDRTMHHMKDEAANFPDPNDRATQESEFGLELRTRDRERKLLKKIEQALGRIDDGTYGFCSETGEEIGLRRLEARPVATLTVEAQERRELAEKQYRDRDDR